MTDITDRLAHEWADHQLSLEVNDEGIVIAARAIKAHVPAPAPTLSEELARIAENSPVWTVQNVCDELKSAAARAAQMQHDLAEARAEVKVLAEDLAGAESEVERLDAVAEDYARRATAALTERDEARAEVDHLKRDLAEAYKPRDARDDEVARLTAERDTMSAMVDSLNNDLAELRGPQTMPVHPSDQQSNTQGILAGSLHDPADVKQGEAWLVECRGERRTAVKDRDDDVPWNTVAADGLFFSEENENVTLVSRLVPAPRVITDHDGLNRAKRNTVIRDGVGVVCERAALGDGWFTTGNGVDQTPYIQFPATVLWEPGA